jgi:hypothetical protein
MFQMINDSISGMGAAGNQYVDTFRRSMAPKADMNDSASLLSYADWARRNGYDDEARQYLALGYKQRALEGEKTYKTRVASDKEKLRGFNESVGRLEQELQIANEQANPQAVYIETALGKVKDARRSLVNDLNDFGAANDYGTGDEGGKAQRALTTEVVAAEKAAIEREKAVTELASAKVELEDAVMKGQPIDLASLPPNLQEQYAGLRDQAMQSDAPVAAMRQLNERFGPISKDYLSTLAEGDKATMALLWNATSDIRNSDAYGKDVKEWIRDNPDLVSKAIEQAEATLTATAEYRTASPEKKQQMAEEALMVVLRGQQADFDDIAIEEQEDLEAEGIEDNARAGYKDRDRNMQYKPGMEQGGAEYKKYFAQAEQALGDEFDPEEFARNWDRKYFSPGGAIAPTSATGSVLRKGPY